MKLIATAYLCEQDANYKPGDEIVGGQLAAHAEHYVAIGKAKWVEDDASPEPPVEVAVSPVKPLKRAAKEKE